MNNQTFQAAFEGFGPTSPAVIAERPEKLGKAQIGYRDASDILSKGVGFLGGYDYSLNPFVGCTFSCVYCYAAGFSQTPEKRDTWGQWAEVKENGIGLMRKRRPGTLDGKSIYLSSATDPYQPVERKVRLTRGILEELAENHRPRLVVQTRSPLVTRDLDLFRIIEERGGRVQVNMTITTDDESIRQAFEPGCPSNHARMKAVSEVAAGGVQAAITLTPLLLVSNPEQFSQDLLETGVRRFIVQGFHISDRRQFVAHTRELAMSVLSDKLGCPESDVMRRYQSVYERQRSIIVDALPQVGEGKDGFRPPF